MRQLIVATVGLLAVSVLLTECAVLNGSQAPNRFRPNRPIRKSTRTRLRPRRLHNRGSQDAICAGDFALASARGRG